mgnify:CR=1 FL=1
MKLIRWLDKYLEESIMMFLLAALACVMMLQIVMRFGFQNALPWPEEFCRYCFLYSIMLATSYCIRTDRMLKVDAVVSLLPRKAVKVMDIISKIMAMTFCIILIYPSYRVMIGTKIGRHWQVSPSMQIPMAIVYSSAFVGFILGSIRGIQSVIIAIRNFSREEDKA